MTTAADPPPETPEAAEAETDFEGLKKHLGAFLQLAQDGGSAAVVDGRSGVMRARIIPPGASWSPAEDPETVRLAMAYEAWSNGTELPAAEPRSRGTSAARSEADAIAERNHDLKSLGGSE